MIECEIFVGFPVDPLFTKEIGKINPNVVSTFIQDKGEYLQEYVYENIKYLGKHVGQNLTLNELDLLENNILSLLRKIVPDYPYEEIPLYLFSIEYGNNTNV